MEDDKALTGVFELNGVEGTMSYEAPGVLRWKCPGCDQDWQCPKSGELTYSTPFMGCVWVFSEGGSIAKCGTPEQQASGIAFAWTKKVSYDAEEQASMESFTGADSLRIPHSCTEYRPSANERAVCEQINTYRQAMGLPAIEISPALCFVAHLHCEDMQENQCALSHGWSDKDPRWKGQKSCQEGGDNQLSMWGKPQELTSGWGTRTFTEKGFENAAGWMGSAEGVVTAWKEEGLEQRPHNDVMVNSAMWRQFEWKSLGAGVYKGYCTAWFSIARDPQMIEEDARGTRTFK